MILFYFPFNKKGCESLAVLALNDYPQINLEVSKYSHKLSQLTKFKATTTKFQLLRKKNQMKSALIASSQPHTEDQEPISMTQTQSATQTIEDGKINLFQ